MQIKNLAYLTALENPDKNEVQSIISTRGDDGNLIQTTKSYISESKGSSLTSKEEQQIQEQETEKLEEFITDDIFGFL